MGSKVMDEDGDELDPEYLVGEYERGLFFILEGQVKRLRSGRSGNPLGTEQRDVMHNRPAPWRAHCSSRLVFPVSSLIDSWD